MNKMLFFDKVISEKREISAYRYNDVFCEFANQFYPLNMNVDKVLANFKKWLRRASEKHSLNISRVRLNSFDRLEFGVSVMWVLDYD